MLHIAVAGSPHSTPGSGGSLKGLEQAHTFGITAMELEWVQRVPMNAEHIEKVGQKAANLGITLTVHAPYYINLNSKEKGKIIASKKRILDALSMAQICGAISVCVHPAFYMGMDPKDAYKNVQRATEDIMEKREKLFPDVNLAYETMGKLTQFGTLEECLKLSKEFGIYPCVDSAHLHARSNGKINSTKEFNEMLDTYVKYLGKRSLKNVHFHYSGIDYGPKGERKHLPLKESDAKWQDFMKVLKKREVGGTLVCESPILEEDTLLLMKYA